MKIAKDKLDNIKAFTQHGFDPVDGAGDEIVGTCPFCAKPKLYVNHKSHAWDCKVCGKSGGFQKWLQAIAEWAQGEFKGKAAINLRKNRGLKIESFRWGGVGFNPITLAYTVPIWNKDKTQIQDIRRYEKRRMMATSTCRAGLFGIDKLGSKNGPLWLCEGEWDGIALREVIRDSGASGDVLAVPGGLTFKTDWEPLFKGRDVIVCYDNDDTGQKGAIKVFNALQSTAATLRFIHWPEGTRDKYDVRDLYLEKGNAADTLTAIEGMLESLPQRAEEDDSGANVNVKIDYDGKGLPADTVREAYRKHFHVPDTDTIDVLFGTVIANRLPGDPIWLFYVAPPGMTKTEYLQSMSDAPEIVAVSTLTPHALVSGANTSAGDPSLIPQLRDRVLVIKDFTTILNMPQMAREEIFGVLRDAFDGHIAKSFGNGVHREYDAKFGILAGVTPAIDTFLEDEASLGERFLRWRIGLPTRIDEHMEYLRRAAANVTKEVDIRNSLRKIAAEALAYDYQDTVTIPKKIEDRILYLSIWTSIMRGTVIRDRYSKEITFQPFQELGTRLSKQFVKEAKGIGMFRRVKKVDEDIYRIIRKLALGTVPSRIMTVMNAALTAPKDTFTPGELGTAVRLPVGTTTRIMENLFLLNALEKSKLSGLKTAWRVTDYYRDLAVKAGIAGK